MCFSLGFIENFLIWLVIICMVVAILRVLVPWICSKFNVSVPAEIMTIFGYILWAMILIFAIVVIFDLISCALAGGGFHLIPRP